MGEIKVSRMAKDVAQEQNFNKKKEIPLQDDVQKLSAYIKTKLQSFKPDPETPTTMKAFTELASTVQVLLSTFNKRRPGEIEIMRYVLHFSYLHK